MIFKKLLLCFVCLSAGMTIFGQGQRDSILVSKSKNEYFYHGRQLSFNEMKPMMKDNPEAYANISKANSRAVVGNVMVFAGAFMVGYTLGTAIRGGDPSVPVVLGGLGVMLGSWPVFSSAHKKANHAVNLYNSEIYPEPDKPKPVQLGFSPNGMCLQYRF